LFSVHNQRLLSVDYFVIHDLTPTDIRAQMRLKY